MIFGIWTVLLKSQKAVSDYKCTLTQHQVTFNQACLDSSFGGSAEKFIITSSDIGMVANHPYSMEQAKNLIKLVVKPI